MACLQNVYSFLIDSYSHLQISFPSLKSLDVFSLTYPLLGLKQMFSLWNPPILWIPDEPPCYVIQAVLIINCLGDTCLSHAI